MFENKFRKAINISISHLKTAYVTNIEENK